MAGPAHYLIPPSNISFIPIPGIFNETIKNSTTTKYQSHMWLDNIDWQVSAACWILFRTGAYTGWSDLSRYPNMLRIDTKDREPQYASSVNVEYADSACRTYANQTTYDVMKHEIAWQSESYVRVVADSELPAAHNCTWRQVACKMGDATPPPCRMTIRMSAALILTICLVTKALYMVMKSVQGRHRKKTQCLTFGDVIIASVKDPTLSINNECLVNSGEAYRRFTNHSCHKHCASNVVSDTGDEIGHCQKCQKFNHVNKAADLQQPSIATKYKKSLLANLGSSALTQMIVLSLTSSVLVVVSIYLTVSMVLQANHVKKICEYEPASGSVCAMGLRKWLEISFGGFGGFNSQALIGTLPRGQMNSEMLAFVISNGAQFLYSLLYLLVIYNFTLISMEHDWGKLERERSILRCTIAKGPAFRQSYLLQLPKWVIFPIMAFSSLMHWLLSQAITTREVQWAYDPPPDARNAKSWEFSQYEVCSSFSSYSFTHFPASFHDCIVHLANRLERCIIPTSAFFICITPTLNLLAKRTPSFSSHSNPPQIVYGSYALFLATILMIAMTSACYWAFTYKREGFMPQFYGSMRICLASTTSLHELSEKGVLWGDITRNPEAKFRHAGFSAGEDVGDIVPAELYAFSGGGDDEEESETRKEK